MEKIISPRGLGKTTLLIKRSADTREIIVCANSGLVEFVQNQARSMQLDIPQPISFSDFVEKKYLHRAGGVKGFLIDDVDLCLQSLSMFPIAAISLSV